jgi:hypothetical protein
MSPGRICRHWTFRLRGINAGRLDAFSPPLGSDPLFSHQDRLALRFAHEIPYLRTAQTTPMLYICISIAGRIRAHRREPSRTKPLTGKRVAGALPRIRTEALLHRATMGRQHHPHLVRIGAGMADARRSIFRGAEQQNLPECCSAVGGWLEEPAPPLRTGDPRPARYNVTYHGLPLVDDLYTTHHVAGGFEVARPVPKQYRRPLLMDLPLLRFSPSHLSSLARRAADLSCG